MRKLIYYTLITLIGAVAAMAARTFIFHKEATIENFISFMGVGAVVTVLEVFEDCWKRRKNK